MPYPLGWRVPADRRSARVKIDRNLITKTQRTRRGTKRHLGEPWCSSCLRGCAAGIGRRFHPRWWRRAAGATPWRTAGRWPGTRSTGARSRLPPPGSRQVGDQPLSPRLLLGLARRIPYVHMSTMRPLTESIHTSGSSSILLGRRLALAMVARAARHWATPPRRRQRDVGGGCPTRSGRCPAGCDGGFRARPAS